MDDLTKIFGDVIFKYTRAQAIEDGMLIDVSETAKEAGFKIPVAVTAAVWERCIKLTPAAEKVGNDINGRLWDVLWMAFMAARRGPDTHELLYKLRVVIKSKRPELVELKLHCGPGDDLRPVITIMLPEED